MWIQIRPDNLSKLGLNCLQRLSAGKELMHCIFIKDFLKEKKIRKNGMQQESIGNHPKRKEL